MDGRRKALYNYSWQQSPINKHRRANSPEEEKKIFDDWFEEKADEYFPLIRDQGLDNETIHANASWTLSSPPCSPKMCRALARVSPKILERLQRPKQDRKTSEELRKETERLANITRYERSLKETRKAIDNIKKEKQRKLMFSQKQHQRLSSCVVLPQHSACSTLTGLPPFQKKFCKEQVTPEVESSVCGSKKLEEKLKFSSISSTNRTRCNNIEERTEQSTSSGSKQQTSGYHNDDDSDSELLRLALESSPIQEPDSALRIIPNEDELSDEALLAMMVSSPASSPKVRKNNCPEL